MDESLLVNRAVAGDLDAFGQLYDAYFNRVYDFSWRILRDADDAADATQDVFMKAMQALPSLTKAASFKSWIFTIAHNVSVTRAERRARTTPLPATHEEAFGGFDVPDASRLDNPELVAEDHELAALVWEAASGLNPRDYALLDLHVRQGLESAEIATVLGVNKGNAYTMVSRMKTAAADVIQSYVVARRGNKDCESLQRVLAAHDFPPYTDDVRHAVDAHIRECEVCAQAKKRLAAPLEILGGFAMVPAPFALKGDVWGNLAAGWPSAGGAEAAAMPGTPDAWPYAAAAAGGGFGGMALGGGASPGDDADSLRNRLLLFAAAVIGLLIFAFAGGAIIAGGFGGDDDGGGKPVATASNTPPGTAAAAGTSTPPGVAVETATPNLTPSPTEEPTETPTPEPPTATAVPATPTDTVVVDTPTPEEDTPTPSRTPRGGATATPTPTP